MVFLNSRTMQNWTVFYSGNEDTKIVIVILQFVDIRKLRGQYVQQTKRWSVPLLTYCDSYSEQLDIG